MPSPCDHNLRPSCRSAGPANASRAQVAAQRACSPNGGVFVAMYSRCPAAGSNGTVARAATRAWSCTGHPEDPHRSFGPRHRACAPSGASRCWGSSQRLAWALGAQRGPDRLPAQGPQRCSTCWAARAGAFPHGLHTLLGPFRKRGRPRCRSAFLSVSTAPDSGPDRTDSLPAHRRPVRLVLAPRAHPLRHSSSRQSCRGAHSCRQCELGRLPT